MDSMDVTEGLIPRITPIVCKLSALLLLPDKSSFPWVLTVGVKPTWAVACCSEEDVGAHRCRDRQMPLLRGLLGELTRVSSTSIASCTCAALGTLTQKFHVRCTA